MAKQSKDQIVLLSIVFVSHVQPALAQDDRLTKIEQRLRALENRSVGDDTWGTSIQDYAPAVPLCLIGLFCGLWARNSGRDFWLWFVGGLIFNIFALIYLAAMHEEDKKAKRAAAQKPPAQAPEV